MFIRYRLGPANTLDCPHAMGTNAFSPHRAESFRHVLLVGDSDYLPLADSNLGLGGVFLDRLRKSKSPPSFAENAKEGWGTHD